MGMLIIKQDDLPAGPRAQHSLPRLPLLRSGLGIRMTYLVFWLLILASSVSYAAGNGPGSEISSFGKTQQSTLVTSVTRVDSLKGWLSGSSSQPELLPPEQAFQVTVSVRDAKTLIAILTPAKDYYLYRSRITFTAENSPGIEVDSVYLPAGEVKNDPNLGNEEVYHLPVQAIIALKRSSAQADQLTLRATYQGCNDPSGVCYPPAEKVFTLALPAASLPGSISQRVANVPAGEATLIPGRTGASAIDADGFSDLFTQSSSWVLIVAFFGFGLLLAFTPCMLPMIPILSGIIVSQKQRVSRRHALGLSVVYVLGMAITYALAGVAAGLAGTMVSAYLQNPWVLGSFAAIFVALALSMFGMYELRLPSSIENRLSGVAGRSKAGRVTGVFLMGVFSAVIVGPCVAAPLAGALLYIAQTRDVVFGGLALFSMAIGMGVPLLVIGTAAGSLLPKAGAWMKSVQRFFGVLLLAVAIYLISPVVPAVLHILLWALLLIIAAMFLHAIDPLPNNASGYRRLWKGVGVVALVTGVALLVGALSGNRDILQPLAGLRSANTSMVESDVAAQSVKNVAELQTQVQAAQGRVVMLDFYADWCVSCKEMDYFTFSDSRVKARLKNVVMLRADVTANNASDQALLKRFALFGPPGIIFFDKQGKEIGFRVIGFETPEKFLTSLDRAGVP